MISKPPQTTYRYERKYLSDQASPWQLEKAILLHPDIFHRIYYPREVWSLYFDTPSKEYYQQNLLGHQKRIKIRVRWYEYNNQQDTFQIEIKQRQGEVLKKIIYPFNLKINSLKLTEITNLVQQQIESHLPESKALLPTVVNHYQRQYFISNQFSCRLTIDSNLKFSTIEDWQQNSETHQLLLTVLEAKYPVEQDINFGRISQQIPLQISRSSKFVMGMQQCFPNNVYY